MKTKVQTRALRAHDDLMFQDMKVSVEMPNLSVKPPHSRGTRDPPKLRRLPDNARIQKRPILHPVVSSPYTGAKQPKVIYVSANTPFVSVVKRVRSLLALIDKRATGKSDLIDGKGSDKTKLKSIEEALEDRKGKEMEEVTLKGTGRAIEKVLGLGLYFQGQDDCRIRLRTGTVGVVDDIMEEEALPATEAASGTIFTTEAAVVDNGTMDVGVRDATKLKEEEDDLPETQIRKLGVVEVGISLRL